MNKKGKPKQLSLFNQEQSPPEPKTNSVDIPASWHPKKVFTDFTNLGHGENAKATARAIIDHCYEFGYTAIVEYDIEIGWVFHTLITSRYIPYRKPIASHFGGGERYVRRQIAAELRLQGHDPKMEVSCSAGRADIVTDEAVFEVKILLTEQVLSTAIDQVLRYRRAIDPAKRAVVIGKKAYKENVDELIAYANSVNVEVVFWKGESL